MATYIIFSVILIYSGWVIYKTIKSKFRGECDTCSGCSLNGSCPIQRMKLEEGSLILNNDLKQK